MMIRGSHGFVGACVQVANADEQRLIGYSSGSPKTHLRSESLQPLNIDRTLAAIILASIGSVAPTVLFEFATGVLHGSRVEQHAFSVQVAATALFATIHLSAPSSRRPRARSGAAPTDALLHRCRNLGRHSRSIHR